MKKIFLYSQRLGDAVDSQLDKLTTYRLVLYLLYIYVGASSVMGFTGKIGYSGWDILASAGYLIAVCRAANWSIGKFLKIPLNHESDLITGLILCLILTPATDLRGYLILMGAGFAAMASKYLLTINSRHVFNPAAAGAFAAGALFHQYASWWIGTRWLAPLTIVGGLLILRKMKRFQMVGVLLLIYLAYLIMHSSSDVTAHMLWAAIISTPVIFFATVMFTEPLTSPASLPKSLVYAALVAILYSVTALHFSPEKALLAGNALTFIMTPSRSLLYSFVGRNKEAEGVYNFIFRVSRKVKFKAGQYMEWTLPGVNADSRGNRRYLTIASSPTEPDVMFTVKIPQKTSSFKSTLMNMKPGDQILASQLAGDFTLPENSAEKLTFIAGGVGITPFRSMIKYFIDTNQPMDAHLFYSVNTVDEVAYRQLLADARSQGLKNHIIISQHPPADWKGLTGRLSEQMIAEQLPDYKQRRFYISGPQGFVAAARQELLKLGVEHSKIKTDFFPGYN